MPQGLQMAMLMGGRMVPLLVGPMALPPTQPMELRLGVLMASSRTVHPSLSEQDLLACAAVW